MKTIANNHLSGLAKKGRYGDTEIAQTSKGELWHVNPEEKSLMDMYGMEGERMVDAIGSGTINPETGLKEQWAFLANPGFWAAAGTVIGAIGGAVSGKTSQIQAESESRQAESGNERVKKALDLAKTKFDSSKVAAQAKYEQDLKTKSFDTNIAVTDLKKGTDNALNQSGMPTSGTVGKESELAWGRIRDKFSSTEDSLLGELGRNMGRIHGDYNAEIAKLEAEKNKFNIMKKSADDRQDQWYLGKNIMNIT